jgi:putative membrane protein
MKNLIYVMMISGGMFALQSCSNSGSTTDTSDTTEMAADSMAAADTASTAPAAASTDTAFTSKAAIGGMAEVELGKLAQEKASNAKVKDFASMMVKDHGKANEELKTIASSKNIVLPATLDQEHKNKLEELKSKSGADFDKAYAAAMVEDHQKTLKLMEDGSANLKDAELKGFAAKTAPVVKHHLDLINSIQSELK